MVGALREIDAHTRKREAVQRDCGDAYRQRQLSRRSVLRGAAGGLAAALFAGTATTAGCGRTASAPEDELFAELDAKIEELMAAYAVPGVAVGVWHRGREHLRGFGVTDIEQPEPVTPDTLFRVGSTTKTFTGTALMRLVDSGEMVLDERVRTYLPDFRTADAEVADRVTVRQLLNHSAGWRGDYYEDFGPGDDALARYTAGIATLPQLTPPGTTFAYNNAAVTMAGHVIEKVTGLGYEQAVRELVLDPLGLEHSGFFADELRAVPSTASHHVVDGQAVLNRQAWDMPRSLHPTGGLISTARDQLRYARFHLGDGTDPQGRTLLTTDSLLAMRSEPGPSGTLTVEVDGTGVTWHLRPTAEGVPVIMHGGAWPGQQSGFYFVPDRDFALTLLTNSDGGDRLIADIMYDDWALQRFAGLHNLPARVRDLTPGQLADYEGRYTSEEIGEDGTLTRTDTLLTADAGRLRHRVLSPAGEPVAAEPHTPTHLGFYRDDHVLHQDRAGNSLHNRSDFVRDETGRVRWLRMGGRLHRRH